MSGFDIAKIKIISVTGEIPPGNSGRPEDYAKVIFKIDKYGPEFSVYVYRPNVSDDNIVRIARHYLHMQAHLIAEATAPWRLSDDDYNQIASPPQKTVQNKGPAIPM
jgi:hypothetical protein